MTKTVPCLDVEGNEHQVPIEDLKWRPAVYGIVIKDGQILLSPQFGSKYDLPGGGLELGEKPEEGVIREVKEETGLDVANPKFIGLQNSFFMDVHAANQAYHCLMLYYACQVVGGELSTDGFDEWEKDYATLAEWIDLKDLDNLTPASTVDYRQFVKKALT